MTLPVNLGRKSMERDEVDICPKCKTKVPYHLRTCFSCEAEIGFPNVRYAQSEADALNQRYQMAKDIAAVQNVTSQIESFERALMDSRAIMIRSALDVIGLLASPNKLWATFAKQVQAGMRIAENNGWDDARISVEPMIHPHYHENIHYAVLSLDNIGATDASYGSCHLLLKLETYRDRATVFEENAILFVRRHHVVSGKPIPKGYRAVWDERQKLVVCKLAPQIVTDELNMNFTELLRSGADKIADFVEVHIYGSMHARSFEAITVLSSGTQASEQKLLKIHAKQAGTPLKIV
jgi:hypothetical protein